MICGFTVILPVVVSMGLFSEQPNNKLKTVKLNIIFIVDIMVCLRDKVIGHIV